MIAEVVSLATSDATRLLDTRKIFEPAMDIGNAEWSIRNVFNEQKRAFDHMAFPHMVAIGGPMDAFDAYWIREVVMQFASRLGKTFAAFCAELRECDLSPCESMNAGPQMELAMTNAARVRKMIDQIPRLAKQVPAISKQARLEFGANIIHTAWARSPATLSDRNIQFGAANEFDLWEHMETKDAPDPEKMFVDRFKDNWTTRKLAFESIPLILGKSRVERRRLLGSNCRLYVECQHCGVLQTLETEHVTEGGYVCPHCRCVNEEHHRLKMLRRCVWVPEGCGVDDDKARVAADRRLELLNTLAAMEVDDPECVPLREELKWKGWAACDYLTGTPARDNDVASFQLGSLHALKLTWKEYHNQNDGSQNFVNQWEGKTFEIEEDEEVDLLEMAQDAAQSVHVVQDKAPPSWASIVTFSADRQLRDYPWQVVAWSEDLSQRRILAAGRELSVEALENVAAQKRDIGSTRRYPHIAVMDSGGFDTTTTYSWCLKMRTKYSIRAYPVKGASSAIDLDYKLNPIKDEKGRAKKWRRLRLCLVNTSSTQHWANRAIKKTEFVDFAYQIPEHHRSLKFSPADIHSGVESQLIELLNEQSSVSPRTSRLRWSQIDSSIPNDMRDCFRYGYCAAQIEQERRRRRAQGRSEADPPVNSPEDNKPFSIVGPGNLDAIVKALNQ